MNKKNEKREGPVGLRSCDICGETCTIPRAVQRKEAGFFPQVYMPGVIFTNDRFGHGECWIAHRLIPSPCAHFRDWSLFWFKNMIGDWGEA